MSSMKRYMEEVFDYSKKTKEIPYDMDFETWQVIFLSKHGEEE
mgnify:FL=1|tara:strand:- start:2484 stop:2612 length:129 start_codon:yes stop_codon:yes gene_type:complete